ncbi:hypothetical protein AB0M25_02670 [Streptomyces griseomycini]|uniref:hypothetical protein n=1 Tax=Streptomyces griseomycini TaxID=66895 RepID=UPI00343578AC
MSIVALPEGDWIRGITTRQPPAACIPAGAKTVENRPARWRPGWMLLYVGKAIDRLALRTPLIARTIRSRDLVMGAVIGVAHIIDCHQDFDDAAGKCGYCNLRNHPTLVSGRRC